MVPTRDGTTSGHANNILLPLRELVGSSGCVGAVAWHGLNLYALQTLTRICSDWSCDSGHDLPGAPHRRGQRYLF